MKKCILLLSTLFLATILIHAQDQNSQNENFDLGVRWGFAILKPGELVGYPGKQVTAVVEYKNAVGVVVYTENHFGTLDDFSYLRFTVGKGTNPQPPDALKPELFKGVTKICWTAFVETVTDPIMGMDNVTSVPRANVAALSLNTEAIGGSIWTGNEIPIEDFPVLNIDERRGLISNTWNSTSGYSSFDRYPTDNFWHAGTTQSVVSGNTVPVHRFGTGVPRRIVFGPGIPNPLSNYYTICVPSLEDALHALGVKIEAAHTSVNHNTAAIYADNTVANMSAGVLAAAQTWGVYGTAQNGVVGVTNGSGNGAGITGFVGAAPDAGGFKYAVYATANAISNAWAAALFGNSFYTGTLTMSSDARLKNEIRSQSHALTKVMQLKPSQYTYRQDTPYSLPHGVHHGFLAQDVELVFPELVTDVTMPLSLDPQEMYRSGTTEYKGINYIEMISILTSALQELNTTLTSKIDAQTAEIAELRKTLNEITEK